MKNNPLWIFHETFNPDQQWVAEHEELYRQGNQRANAVAEETLYLARQAMKQDYFPRKLSIE